LVQKSRAKTAPLTTAQPLLVLDTWRRSGLPAGDLAALVGLSKHTLYAWKKKFDQQGPAGLMDQPRGAPAGSRLPDLTRRTILLLKESNHLGLSAHQRHAAAWSRLAGQCRGRGAA
jgi:transposase